jgi:hypothetical protein
MLLAALLPAVLQQGIAASNPATAPVWPEPKSWTSGSAVLALDPHLRVSWLQGSGGSPALERAVARFRLAAFPHPTANVSGGAFGRLSVLDEGTRCCHSASTCSDSFRESPRMTADDSAEFDSTAPVV